MPEDRNPCFLCEHKHEPKNSGVCEACTKPYFYIKALGEDDQFIKQTAVKAPKKEEIMPDTEPNATIDKILESQKTKGPIKKCNECALEFDEIQCKKICNSYKNYLYRDIKKIKNPENKKPSHNPPQTITLNFSRDRDAKILEEIKKIADDSRRNTDQMIMCILEMSLNSFRSPKGQDQPEQRPVQ